VGQLPATLIIVAIVLFQYAKKRKYKSGVNYDIDDTSIIWDKNVQIIE